MPSMPKRTCIGRNSATACTAGAIPTPTQESAFVQELFVHEILSKG